VISAQCAACSASTVFPRFLISALLLASALTIALPSHARPVRIDFDEAPFENNGGGWPDAFDDAVDATAGPAGGTLAFGLRLGDTLFDSFCVSEDGFVGLQVGSTTCTGTTPADYAAVIAPLFDPDLVSVFPAASYEAGSVSYSVGYVDLEAPYNLDEAVTAMRFFWNSLTTNGENRIFQLFLYDTGGGNGDFDLEFAYGVLGDEPYATGAQFISLDGQSLLTGTGPFGPETDYLFAFRDGAIGGTTPPPPPPPPTPVPEPASLLLLLAGLAALRLSLLRRA